ncbi:hypothetical protein AMTRI_Chr02g256300 [Amborella trichopoda]
MVVLGAADARISEIFVYPIKSCRGISLPQCSITPTGFRWDRQWMVVNSKGRAYTQRVEPKLALVEVDLPKEAFTEDWNPTDESYLVLKAPGMETLKVSLNKNCKKIDGVSVWEWSGPGLDEGPEASNWFSKYLEKPSQLVRFNTELGTRYVDHNYAHGYKTMFSDGYPFMLISQASLDALNKILDVPLPINRFRPNILVEGCEPFSEDLWKVLKISKLMFNGVKLCSRCKVPTINQDTGIVSNEPTATLKKFRSDQALCPTKRSQGKVYFGQNLVCNESISPSGGGKVVRVGDPVYVVQKHASPADAAA